MHEILKLRQLMQPQIQAMQGYDQPQMIMPEQKYDSKPLLTLLHINSQIKVFHWQTESYAQHVAFGDYYNAMDELTDTFVEAYQGKYCRIELQPQETFNIGVKGFHDNHISIFLDEVCHFLSEILPSTHSEDDTELCNIIDEMIAETNKLKYLLTLK